MITHSILRPLLALYSFSKLFEVLNKSWRIHDFLQHEILWMSFRTWEGFLTMSVSSWDYCNNESELICWHAIVVTKFNGGDNPFSSIIANIGTLYFIFSDSDLKKSVF